MTIQDDKFNQTLIDKIKDKKISPTPKWHFLLKNYAIWIVGLASLVLGAIAVSLIIFMLRFNDWDLYLRAGKNPLERLLMVIPFFWLICMAVFLILVYFEIKKTKTGYRYPTLYIILGSLAASVILGGIFYGLGFGEKIDDILGRQAPFYEQVINPHVRFGSNPKDGRLAGLIISQPSPDKFILVDIDRQEWNLLVAELEVDQDFSPEVGKPARFIGNQTGDHEFNAKKFFPITPGKKFFNRFDPKLLPPMMSPEMDASQKGRLPKEAFCDNGLGLQGFFLQYPELKEAFAKDLLENKDAFRDDKKAFEFINFLYPNSGLVEQLR